MSPIRQQPDPYGLIEPDPFGLYEPYPFRFLKQPLQKDHQSKSSQSLFKQNNKNTVGYPQEQQLPAANRRQPTNKTQPEEQT